MTNPETPSKFEIAVSQLDLAIELFMKQRDFESVITLAGAAEEILGKIVSLGGENHAFGEKIERYCELHLELFNEEANHKEYVELLNRSRNAMKHITGYPSTGLGLEREAASRINLAISNYAKLKSDARARFHDYQQYWPTRFS